MGPVHIRKVRTTLADSSIAEVILAANLVHEKDDPERLQGRPLLGSGLLTFVRSLLVLL